MTWQHRRSQNPKYVRAVCRRPRGRRHGQPQQHRSDWPRPLTTLADMRCAPSSTQSPAAATGKSVPAQRGMHTRSSGSKSDCRHAEQQPLVPPAAASRAIAAAWRPLGLRSTMPQQQQPRESCAGDSFGAASLLPAGSSCRGDPAGCFCVRRLPPRERRCARRLKNPPRSRRTLGARARAD